MTKTKLGEILESKHMSKEELMDRTGLSNIVINGYINGKREPSVSSLLKISKALNVTLDAILDNNIEREETAFEFKCRILDYCEKHSKSKGKVRFIFNTNEIFTDTIPKVIYDLWGNR